MRAIAKLHEQQGGAIGELDGPGARVPTNGVDGEEYTVVQQLY